MLETLLRLSTNCIYERRDQWTLIQLAIALMPAVRFAPLYRWLESTLKPTDLAVAICVMLVAVIVLGEPRLNVSPSTLFGVRVSAP